MRLIACALSLLCLSGVAFGQQQSFVDWRGQFRDQALAAGITSETFDIAMAGVKPIASIIDLDHTQPEVKLRFSDYVRKLASDERRAGVRRRLDEERALLAEVGRRFHVQPRFIVALWGIETDFGQFPGDYPVIAALATLAYDAVTLAAALARNGAADPFNQAALTSVSGFNGADGVFRFRADGTNERGLAVMEIDGGAAKVISPAPRSFAAG